jgi:hypothetical protein
MILVLFVNTLGTGKKGKNIYRIKETKNKKD